MQMDERRLAGPRPGAIPSVVPELLAALHERQPGALPHRSHGVRVTLAYHPLFRSQSRDAAADYARSDGHYRREGPVEKQEQMKVDNDGGCCRGEDGRGGGGYPTASISHLLHNDALL